MADSVGKNEKQGGTDAESELDWIMVHGYADVEPQETLKSRFKRKFAENPFIPIGCLATAGILGMGLASMMQDNRRYSQLLMRLRVASQGLTVMALVGGAVVSAKKSSKHGA